MRRALAAAICACTVTASQAQAPAAPGPYNVVSLQADVQREVDNDVLGAVLYVELTDADPARLADALNRAINAALATASSTGAVRARSGGYRTFPVYDDRRRLTQWRGRAELRMESRDFEAASALIGKLQSSLQVAGVSFSVSTPLRQKVQDELIVEAIAAFRARAALAQRALGGRGYKIRQLNINTGFAGPQPLPEARALAASPVSAPQFEAGTSRISVSTTGSVEVD